MVFPRVSTLEIAHQANLLAGGLEGKARNFWPGVQSIAAQFPQAFICQWDVR